jgi:hypothetical protein
MTALQTLLRLLCLIVGHKRSRGSAREGGSGRLISVCRRCKAPMEYGRKGWHVVKAVKSDH